MKFGFVAKHRGIWPVRWICEMLDVSASGFYQWAKRPLSDRSRRDTQLLAQIPPASDYLSPKGT